MSQGNSSSGKFAGRNVARLVGLFSVVLLLLGLVANPSSPLALPHAPGGIPSYLVLTLVGILGVVVHAALLLQWQKIQTLEAELSQIRAWREN